MRHSQPPFMSVWLFQKKSKEGVGRQYIYIYFSEKNHPELLDLSLCLPLEKELLGLLNTHEMRQGVFHMHVLHQATKIKLRYLA